MGAVVRVHHLLPIIFQRCFYLLRTGVKRAIAKHLTRFLLVAYFSILGLTTLRAGTLSVNVIAMFPKNTAEFAYADVLFICVQTPPTYAGDADLSFVWSALVTATSMVSPIRRRPWPIKTRRSPSSCCMRARQREPTS